MSSSLEKVPVAAFVIAYSDSGFTNPHETVLADPEQDCHGSFTHMGAKFWGFETSRHRATSLLTEEQAFTYDHDAHNWIVIGLKERTYIRRITVSTKWYTGNHVRAISAFLTDELTGKRKQILDHVKLNPDAEHSFEIDPTLATECRIECYHEGGIARINFFGETAEEQLPLRANLLEAATISHVSNAHFGRPEQAVAGMRKEMHMVGWESARTGYGEQALFHLKEPANIDEVVVDTYLHRLNPPLTCHLFGIAAGQGEAMDAAPRWKVIFTDGREIIPDNFQEYMLNHEYAPEKNFKIVLHLSHNSPWQAILPFAPLMPDTYHRFRQLEKPGPVSKLLYMHYPNGGIHGLKVFGA